MIDTTYDGSLKFDTQIDTDGFKSGTNTIKSQANGLKSTIASLGKTMVAVFGVRQLVKLGKQAIETSSDLQEVQNVVDTAFGSMSYKMEEFAKTSKETFGLSKLAAKQNGSTFMAMAKNMLKSEKVASDMAVTLTGLTGDWASFYNVTTGEAATALNGIFTGETEVLKRYGYVMTEANLQAFAFEKGSKKKLSAMTQEEKVMLRYNYITEKSAMVQGDFAKTSGSWANQTRILTEYWKEFLGILGTGLIQVLTPVVKALNTGLTYLIQFATYAGKVLSSVFGISNQIAGSTTTIKTATEGAAAGYAEAGDAIEEAGKQAKGAAAPFDMLNEVSSLSDTDASSMSTSIDTTIDEANANNELAESSEALSEKLKPLTTALKKLWKACKPFGENVGDGLKWFYDEVIVPISGIAIEDTLPDFLYAVESAVTAANTAIGKFKESDGDETLGGFISGMYKIGTSSIGDQFTKIGDALSAFTDFMNAPNFDNFRKFILELIEAGISGLVMPTLQLPVSLLEYFTGFDVTKWYTDNIEPYLSTEGAKELVVDIKAAVATKWEDIKGDWEELSGKIKDRTIKFLINFPQTAPELLKKWALLTINLTGKTVSFLVKIPQKWSELQSAYTKLYEKFVGKTVRFIFTIPQKWDDLKEKYAKIYAKFLGKSVSFLVTIPQKWKDLSTLYYNLYNGFKGKTVDFVVNLITSLGDIKDFINALIDELNTKVLAQLTFTVDIPFTQNDWVWKAPLIPRLATGTVIPPNSEFLALLGDQQKGVNIEAPLDTIVDAFRKAQSENKNGSGPVTVNVYIGRKKIHTEVVEEDREYAKQHSGHSAFAY